MVPETDRNPGFNERLYDSSRLARIGNYIIAQRRRTIAGLAAASCAIGLAGLSATSAKGEKSSSQLAPMELISITTDDIYTNNVADANNAAQEVAAMGANAVRFIYKVNKDTAWDAYKNTVCVAVNAAMKYNLQPIIAFEGVDSHGLGYYPRTRTEVKQFVTTAATVFWDLASKNGCASSQKRWIFEVNEPNNDTFNRYQTVDTPSQTMELDTKLSAALQIDAAKPEIGATVIYADSLAEGNHVASSFLAQQCQALKQRKLPNPYGEVWIHPYDQNPSAGAVDTMTREFPLVKKIISDCFPGSQYGLGEWGVNTKPLPSLAKSYSSNALVVGVSESTKAKYVLSYLQTAAAEGATTADIFDINDSGGGSMPSAGDIRIDGNKKASYNADSAAIRSYTHR